MAAVGTRRLACLCAVGLSLAAPPSEGRDFSAERVVTLGTSTVKTHINAKDDRWRFEFAVPQGGVNVVIVRVDRRSAWHILSKRRQYAEVPIGEEHRLSVGEAMEGERSREFIGDQILNGYLTELFEVTVAEKGGIRQYYQWVTKKERFPMKTVSKQGSWSEEYRHLRFTEQSPFLFELPHRIDPVSPPTARPSAE
jgi:hypothetical protein